MIYPKEKPVIKSIMKNLLNIILLLPLITAAQLQPSIEPIAAFHNTTWEWTDGTYIFQVHIIDCEVITNRPPAGICSYVRYSMKDTASNILYQARLYPAQPSDDPIGGILGAYDSNPPFLYGQIEDHSDPNYIYWIEGMLKITYIPCQGTGCDPQIRWVINRPKELVKDPSAPDEYNLPTDIVLTKTN